VLIYCVYEVYPRTYTELKKQNLFYRRIDVNYWYISVLYNGMIIAKYQLSEITLFHREVLMVN